MGQYCDSLRVLRINESESLGPAMARYFASKLWHGEAFYMQIDAHMFFAEVRAGCAMWLVVGLVYIH